MMSSLARYTLSLILAAFPPGKHPEVETRAAGVSRIEVVARALADSAEKDGAAWPEGATDLARAGISAFGWSMGFRRDVQVGEKRGPAGEACFADMQPRTLRYFATFETAGLTDAELAARVIGLDYDSLRRCFDAGFAGLVNARRHAGHRCKAWPVEMATFAIYANGNYCSSGGRSWIERFRFGTLRKFRARTETVFPSWYITSSEASS